MAKSTKKSKKSTAKASSSTRVTRITASDSAPKKKKAPATSKTKVHSLTASEKADITETKQLSPAKKPAKAEEQEQLSEKQSRVRRKPLRALKEYFVGAWYELRQVRWPDRPTSLKMTGTLLVFTAFMTLVIVLLDALFRYLFELMLG